MRTHPQEILAGDLRKFDVLFISIHKYGSAENTGPMRYMVTASLALFRILLWIAIAGATFWILRPTRGRPDGNLLHLTGAIFIAVIAACVLPYMLGFAYTRHVSILIYPSVLMCCRMLAEQKLALGNPRSCLRRLELRRRANRRINLPRESSVTRY